MAVSAPPSDSTIALTSKRRPSSPLPVESMLTCDIQTGNSKHHPSTASHSSSTPLFTPIWDYDRFPVGPCIRHQEQENPFIVDYSQHHHPQRNSPRENNMPAFSLSPSASSTEVDLGDTRRHKTQHESRHEGSYQSQSLSNQDVVSLSVFTAPNSGLTSFLEGHYPSLSHAADADAEADADTSFSGNSASLSYHSSRQQGTPSGHAAYGSSTPPPMLSKFDRYMAQRERLRSARTSASLTSSASSKPSLSQPLDSPRGVYPATKKTAGLIPKLFKRNSDSNQSSSRDRKRSPHRHLEPQMTALTTPSLSQSSLSSEKDIYSSSPRLSVHIQAQGCSSSNREKYEFSGASIPSSSYHANLTRVTVNPTPCSSQKEQQDRWREDWLKPSGAIHSMFRDRPSKFNCPHCGAVKVVSDIQFVPGVMSYLVAFGLLFLTLGTLSYLPLRKDHEGTKDCIHWCPICERRVARYNRANDTWEWI